MHHFGIGHMLLSALIHGIIYGLIFKLMRHMSLPEAAAFAAVAIVALLVFSKRR